MAQVEETLRQLLEKIAVQNQYKNYEIIINPLSSGGANYSSVLFTAIIREANKEDLQLFAKFAMSGEEYRKSVPVDVFKIERYAYTKLFKIYSTIEKGCGVPEEHRLVFTKCYGYENKAHQEILVLENLLAKGYGPHDRFSSVDWEYAYSAVTDMAKFHALSFAFKKRYPDEFEKICSTVFKMELPEGFMDVMVQNSAELALQHVKPEHKESLEKFLDDYKSNFYRNLYKPLGTIAIIHGDYRGSNLMHRVREDGKVDIKILDLQTVQAGCPVSDLIYFIFCATDQEFRDKYYEKLVELYYTQLTASLKRLQLDVEKVYSRKDFDDEMEKKLPYGLALSVVGLPVLTVAAEDAPVVDESFDMSNLEVKKTGELYPKRLNEVVDDFVKWGILK